MKAAAFLLGFFLALAAGRGEAAWRVGLHALSPDAERAILSYNVEWVEVTLATGHTRLIVPPPTCSWTSADYAPDGTGFALTAQCSADPTCEAVRTGLWRSDPDWGTAHIATAMGRRWGEARWRADGRAVLVTETRLFTPRATGLSTLQRGRDCAAETADFVSISLMGRAALLDFLPRGWEAVSVLSATRGSLDAALRIRDLGRSSTSAERAVAAFCAEIADKPTPRAPLCEPEGGAAMARWDGEGWTLEPGALIAAPKDRGRLLLSANGAVRVEERCTPHHVEGQLRPQCRLSMAGPHGTKVFDAPAGLFGDLAISASGRFVGALLTGRGQAARRFDLFDVETGAMTSFAPLLELTPPWDETR